MGIRKKKNTAVGRHLLAAWLYFLLRPFWSWQLTANKRVKEMQYRKVLGASVFGVPQSALKRFLKLVALALLMRVPVAW